MASSSVYFGEVMASTINGLQNEPPADLSAAGEGEGACDLFPERKAAGGADRLIRAGGSGQTLHSRVNIHINRFPVPDAEDPYFGPDHSEDDPVITHAELPVPFQ
jgi:hypothetical protein